MAYSYFFKNTHYFRKMIHPKYIKNRSTYLYYRRSLKLCMNEDFYLYLTSNKEELDKILEFINYKLTYKLQEGKELDIVDINSYIQKICEEYRELACIENSELEDKRIEALKYIDEDNKLHAGFHLQALTVKFKEIDEQYSDFSDKQITQKLAMEIIKRSNISIEKIFKEIPADKLINFYEILIKNEREVLKNDIKLYIKRNLIQFYPLISSNIKEESEKVEQALYKYLSLVQNNPKQKNYLSFIERNSINQNNSNSFNITQSLNKDELISMFKESLKEDEQKKVLDATLNIDSIIDDYITFKDNNDKIRQRIKRTLLLFKDYLLGNGNEYKAKNIKDLTVNDIIEINKLFSELTPFQYLKKNKLNLFESVVFRRENPSRRYADNTMNLMTNDIKSFWRYICKYKDTTLSTNLFDSFNPKYDLKKDKYNNSEPDKAIRAFKIQELQIFIDNVFNSNLKKILMDSPKNFYYFFMGLMLGLRIGEFIQIRLEDIKVQEKDGLKTYYIYLNENHPEQSLKNQNAHRNISIPEVLIDLGLLNYIDTRKKRGKEWLWDFTKSGYGSISVFFQRHIKNLFPESSDNLDNHKQKIENYNVVQSRSFRKNFVEFALGTRHINNHSTENAKRIIGHTEGTISETYLGRIEPAIGKNILDSFGDYNLNLEKLKNDVKDYYRIIKRDLDIKDDNTWRNVSVAKPKRGRRI